MKKKLGPLPLWAWIAIAGGAVLLYLYERKKSEQAALATGAGTPDATAAGDTAAGLTGAQQAALAKNRQGFDPYPGGYGGRPVYQGPSWTQIQQWLKRWTQGQGKGKGKGKGGGDGKPDHSTEFPPSSVANARWQIWHLRGELVGANKDKRDHIHREINLLQRWLGGHKGDPSSDGTSTSTGSAASRASSHTPPALAPADRFFSIPGGQSFSTTDAAPIGFSPEEDAGPLPVGFGS